MKSDDIVRLLTNRLPQKLSEELVSYFFETRNDLFAGHLGRASPGKFVEALVQALEYLETNAHTNSPKVDEFLRQLESRTTTLPDGLKICCSRVGRAIQAFRNKRSIAHKNAIDPSLTDLKYVFAAMQWILCELIRETGGNIGSVEAALKYVSSEPGSIIEDFGTRKLVLVQLPIEQEILILLLHSDSGKIVRNEILKSIDRVAKQSVLNAVGKLWKKKQIERIGNSEIQITALGRKEALEAIKRSAY
jgi:Mn-dependent DtxR family transcriptional regulator